MGLKKRQITRNNHYVAKWYQRGFLSGSQTTLHRLDQTPPEKTLPDGRTILQKALEPQSPTQCFVERDLYTTRFGRELSDEIERVLFGAIDNSGANAVRAFAGGDPREMHEHFLRFFEYLNAQKLRTPKGLDWIKSRYPTLEQAELMAEMERLRQMHCTMWCECVREVVSAEESDVKFIVTDHPVTVYNSACDPASSACRNPDDPPIDLKGTQTVFALDSNHCLILTNLELAQNPTEADPLERRTNPRFSGETLTMTNAMIRERKLTSGEVIAINTLLKARSRRYLAAYEEDWLFPEKTKSVSWEEIGKTLLPPKDLLWDFGGEIIVGYKDGSARFQDAFGRTDASHEALKKKAPSRALDPNDPCGCGSGRKYKKCCRGVAIEDRPPWDVLGIRDRIRVFISAALHILGLDDGKTWEDVRRELSDDQVKRVHKVVEALWPKDTDIANLLPRPDGRVFRAVYMGLVDPRTISLSVISSLAYFDEIIVLNPFPNPLHMSAKYSPTLSPVQHKSQMLKNVVVLMQLQPFIDSGIVHLVPDPMEFNAETRLEMKSMIDLRKGNWEPTTEEVRLMDFLRRDDLKRLLLRFPEEQSRRQVSDSHPDLSPEQLDETIRNMKEELINDPYALLQPIAEGEDSGEIQGFRSMNLELALFYAQLTGACIYTDQPAHWRQLHEHTSAAGSTGKNSNWSLVATRTESFRFPIETNPQIILEERNAGKLGRMRSAFRRIWNAAPELGESADANENARRLANSLQKATKKVAKEWDRRSTASVPSTRLRQRIKLSAPPSGFYKNGVNRLLITSGRTNYIQSVPIALQLLLEDAEGKEDAGSRLGKTGWVRKWLKKCS